MLSAGLSADVATTVDFSSVIVSCSGLVLNLEKLSKKGGEFLVYVRYTSGSNEESELAGGTVGGLGLSAPIAVELNADATWGELKQCATQEINATLGFSKGDVDFLFPESLQLQIHGEEAEPDARASLADLGVCSESTLDASRSFEKIRALEIQMIIEKIDYRKHPNAAPEPPILSDLHRSSWTYESLKHTIRKNLGIYSWNDVNTPIRTKVTLDPITLTAKGEVGTPFPSIDPQEYFNNVPQELLAEDSRVSQLSKNKYGQKHYRMEPHVHPLSALIERLKKFADRDYREIFCQEVNAGRRPAPPKFQEESYRRKLCIQGNDGHSSPDRYWFTYQERFPWEIVLDLHKLYTQHGGNCHVQEGSAQQQFQRQYNSNISEVPVPRYLSTIDVLNPVVTVAHEIVYEPVSVDGTWTSDNAPSLLERARLRPTTRKNPEGCVVTETHATDGNSVFTFLRGTNSPERSLFQEVEIEEKTLPWHIVDPSYWGGGPVPSQQLWPRKNHDTRTFGKGRKRIVFHFVAVRPVGNEKFHYTSLQTEITEV